VGYGAEAVVLGEGVLVEQHPLRKAQFGGPRSVPRQRVELCHVLMGEDQVVPRSIHILRHLREQPGESDYFKLARWKSFRKQTPALCCTFSMHCDAFEPVT